MRLMTIKVILPILFAFFLIIASRPMENEFQSPQKVDQHSKTREFLPRLRRDEDAEIEFELSNDSIMTNSTTLNEEGLDELIASVFKEEVQKVQGNSIPKREKHFQLDDEEVSALLLIVIFVCGVLFGMYVIDVYEQFDRDSAAGHARTPPATRIVRRG